MPSAPSAASTWTGAGSVRNVFTFGSGDVELYGSLYAPSDPVSVGVVVCPAWGAEARAGERLCRSFARRVAGRGGAALVFDWPGQGESGVEPEKTQLSDLVAATVAAVSQVKGRLPVDRVALGGFRLGASIAALSSEVESVDGLVFMQPVWDPGAHFASVERASKRAGLGAKAPDGWAFGFPFPATLGFADSNVRVLKALADFAGPAAAFGYGSDASPPPSVEFVELTGDWKQAAAREDGRLGEAAAAWVIEAIGKI